MAEPGDAAEAFIRDAPFEVLRALLGRLSPKWILRMRSVCKPWREKLCNVALLTLLNRAEPPQPLLCFDRAACADRYIRLSDYCVESLDLRSGELRAVCRFTDNEDYFQDDYDLEGRDAPPIIGDYLVDYERVEHYGEAIFKPQVTVHASLNGYLLVSFSSRRRWYVINPATRGWVSLFDPTTFGLDVVGFYEQGRCGKYYLLCLRRNNVVVQEEGAPTYSYHVIGVRPGERRHIGCPLSPAVRNDHGLRFGVARASISPPVQWKRTMALLWPPQQSQGYHMLVFDIWSEVFSWKRAPPPVTMTDDQDMRLLELSDGNLGLSVSRENEAMLELWSLQDCRNEVWVLKHRVQLALQQMPALQLHEDPWIPAVVSAEGDVLIESRHGLFHCDRDGNLLHRFQFDDQTQSRVLPIRHVLRKSLVQHPMFQPSKYAAEPPFFRWLCSD